LLELGLGLSPRHKSNSVAGNVPRSAKTQYLVTNLSNRWSQKQLCPSLSTPSRGAESATGLSLRLDRAAKRIAECSIDVPGRLFDSRSGRNVPSKGCHEPYDLALLLGVGSSVVLWTEEDA